MRVMFLGTGDAFGTGGRFQTCIGVEAGGGFHLVDCGPTALISMHREGIDPDCVDGVILTHLHGDHMGGLPFLILDAQFVRRRTRPLIIAGPPGTDGRVHILLEAMFPGSAEHHRPYEIQYITLEPDTPRQINGLDVSVREVTHESGAPSQAVRLEADGRAFAFTGDTEWCDAIAEISAEADLLVAECYGFDKKIVYHNTHADLLANAHKLSARRIYLTHMGPEMLSREAEAHWPRARDGLVLDLNEEP